MADENQLCESVSVRLVRINEPCGGREPQRPQSPAAIIRGASIPSARPRRIGPSA